MYITYLLYRSKIKCFLVYYLQAGLAATDTPLSYEVLKDHDAMDRILAETKPMWEPGTNYGYHGITFGLYVDALIRRTDPKKRTVGQFFDEEVSKPFGKRNIRGTMQRILLEIAYPMIDVMHVTS